MTATWSKTIPYRSKRVPYLPRFFRDAAKALHFTREHRLLDIACGIGDLTFGFAPYVGRLVGIDLEEPMLVAARAEAVRRNIDAEFRQTRIEDLPDDLGIFQIVTIGKAHWYLPRAETISALETLVDPTGVVLICTAVNGDHDSDPWLRAYYNVMRKWRRAARPNISARKFMMGSSFLPSKSFEFVRRRKVSVEDVLTRSLAFHGTTPDILGSDTDLYIAEMRAAIEPHASEGVLQEVLETKGIAFSRP